MFFVLRSALVIGTIFYLSPVRQPDPAAEKLQNGIREWTGTWPPTASDPNVRWTEIAKSAEPYILKQIGRSAVETAVDRFGSGQ